MVVGEYHRVFGVTRLEESYEEKSAITAEMDAAYLHERIHYIQDFGSVYGINMAVYKLSYYLDIIGEIRNGKFPMILSLSDDGDFVDSCFKCMQGDSLNEGRIKICHVIEEIEIEDPYIEYYQESYPDRKDLFRQRIIIRYNGGKEFAFGGDAVSESMAYLFERFLFNSNDYENCLPYNACELLYEHILEEKCTNLPVIIAICYASLLNPWPGNTFYELLLEIKKSKLVPQNMSQVFTLAKGKIRTVSEQQMENLFERIDSSLPISEDEVSGQKITRTFMENLRYCNDWLKERYQFITDHEIEFREALVYILETIEESKRIPAMRNLLDLYGHPVVIDKNGKLYDASDSKLVFLLAPYALQEIVMEKKKSCALFNVCKAYKKRTNSDCINCCWKVDIPNTVCILRFYLYVMNLGGTQFDELLDSPF